MVSEPTRDRAPKRVERVVVLAAVVLCGQLFLPPVVGLANNGDFGKVAGLFSLGAPFEDEYRYADLKYSFEPKYYSRPPFLSSETLVAAAAVGLNRVFSKSGSFDMRWMGAVHGAFALALYLFLPLLSTVLRGGDPVRLRRRDVRQLLQFVPYGCGRFSFPGALGRVFPSR